MDDKIWNEVLVFGCNGHFFWFCPKIKERDVGVSLRLNKERAVCLGLFGRKQLGCSLQNNFGGVGGPILLLLLFISNFLFMSSFSFQNLGSLTHGIINFHIVFITYFFLLIYIGKHNVHLCMIYKYV